MDHSSSISVIIPTYNRAGWLEECLHSVIKQTLSPREIIVVDDGSTDHTRDLCSRLFPHISYLYQPNRGVSAARNCGIAKARGDWIAFLDSDDMWLPLKLERQRDYFAKHPEVTVLQTEEIWIRRGRRVNPRPLHKKPSGWVFSEMIPLCLVSPSAVMLHKSVFDQVGLFDETLPACEDYDLWLRVALHYQIVTLDEALTIKRGGHADQLSRQWGLDCYRIRALEKIYGHEKINDSQKKAVAKDICRRCDILIKGFEKRRKTDQAAYYRNLLNTYGC